MGGKTALHYAASEGLLDVCVALLEAGEEEGKKDQVVNAVAENGASPLHLAAQRGHADVLSLLLRHGGDPNTPMLYGGERPLHYAVLAGERSKHQEMRRKILEASARKRK